MENMKLTVDMGKVFTTYAVEKGNNLEEFQVMESTQEDIISGLHSMHIFDTTFSNIKTLIRKYPEIKRVNVIIPAKTELITSKTKITQEKIVDIVKNDLGIDVGRNELSVGIGKVNELPNGGYTASLSIYDAIINSLYNLLEDGIEVNLYSNLDRLIYRAGFTKGKVVLIDASHKETRVLFAYNGKPVKFVNYGNINGLELVLKMNEPIGKVFVMLSDMEYLESKEGKEIDKLIENWSLRLAKDISKFSPDTTFLYGGLALSRHFWNNLPNPTYDIPNTTNLGVDVGPLMYKYIQIETVPNDFEINNLKSKQQIGVTQGINSYEDIKIEILNNIENDKSYFSPEVYNLIKESKLNSSQRRMVADHVNKAKSIYYESDGVTDAGRVEEEGNKSILSYKKADTKSAEILEKSKRNYKKPGTKESKYSALFLGIGTIIIILFMYIMVQTVGCINDPTLNSLGIVSPLETEKYTKIEEGLYNKLASSLKDQPFNSKNFSAVTVKKSDKEVVIRVEVPAQIKGVEDMDVMVTELFKPFEEFGVVDIMKLDNEDTTYQYYLVRAKLNN